MATPRARRGRAPKAKRLWCIAHEGDALDPKRRFLSWADAVDELDLDHSKVLYVEAPTYAESRIIKGIVVKAASRRFVSLAMAWDGKWVSVQVSS